MSATSKILSVLLALGSLFVSIFLIVYFALVGLVLVPLVIGFAYLLWRAIKSGAKKGKESITDNTSENETR